jgi:type IV pilus assembly protein PilC
VKLKELQIMTKQFATLVKSGIPIVQALELLGAGVSPGPLKDAISNIATSVREGKRLSEAMANYPNAFDRMYVNMIRAGEEGGVLDTVLLRISEYLDRSMALRAKIMKAVQYPIIVVFVSFIVVGVILTFVIPKFKELFAQSGQALPGVTQFVIDASDMMVKNIGVIFGTIGIVVFLVVNYRRTPDGKIFFDGLVLKIPLLNTVIIKGSLARLARTLGSLMAAGVPILEALEMSANTLDNSVLESMVRRIRSTVLEGKMMTQAMAKEPLIPNLFVQMVTVGEQSGQIDSMLEKLAEIYEEEVDVASQNLAAFMEPLLLLGVGGFVATIVIAMYLPMFSMAGAASGG